MKLPGIFLTVLCLVVGVGNPPQAPPSPVPLISWLTPSSTVPGGPGLALAVYGSGFVSGSVVRWNGLSLATTFLTANQLTAAIPSASTAADGTASIPVFNPAPGGGISNASPFSVTNP